MSNSRLLSDPNPNEPKLFDILRKTLIFNSNDFEADDLLKELLLLGIQRKYNNPEENDVIGQLAFYLSTGKDLMPFVEKKRRLQDLATSTQIYKGSQSLKEKFKPSELETIKKLISAVNVLISTAAPIEFFECWRQDPALFKDKTLIFYGSVNTNEWLLSYIQKHHPALCQQFENDPALQQICGDILKNTADKNKLNNALDNAKAHLVIRQFFSSFRSCYCLENFPLWGVQGASSSYIITSAYPITASHSKALYTTTATELGPNVGIQVRDEASTVAKKQGDKIAGFIKYAPNGSHLWVAFCEVLKRHRIEIKDPKAILTQLELFRDNTALINDLSQVLNKFCEDNEIKREEKTYENSEGKVSIDLHRAFTIWSRTAPYDYQILNADSLVAIALYEIFQQPDKQLLLQNLIPQTLTGFDGSYLKFTPDTESQFYYPKTLSTKEDIKRLTLYLDILMGQLLYAANKTLQPHASWMRIFQASGLAAADPVALSARLLQDISLQRLLQEVFATQNLDSASRFNQMTQNISITGILIQHRSNIMQPPSLSAPTPAAAAVDPGIKLELK